MVALAVNLRKRHQAMSHACSHTKVLAHRPVRCCKQLTCLANLAISVTSIGQSRLMTASCSACLDIWPHTFEGEFLDCNGRRGPVLQSRQHRVTVIEAASLAVQTELRACGILSEKARRRARTASQLWKRNSAVSTSGNSEIAWVSAENVLPSGSLWNRRRMRLWYGGLCLSSGMFHVHKYPKSKGAWQGTGVANVPFVAAGLGGGGRDECRKLASKLCVSSLLNRRNAWFASCLLSL